MKIVGTLALIALMAASTSSQQLHFPEKDVLFGTANADNDSARICLATDGPTGAPWCISALGFDFTNGPPGEVNYKNHTRLSGYNVLPNGNKVVPGLVSFGWSDETKFRNGVAGQPGHFMSEHHFNWCNPDGSVCIRPAGATVQYNNGDLDLAVHGNIRFFRNASNGNTSWGVWKDDGSLDLTAAPTPRIAFPNNFPALCWRNPPNTNVVCPLYVDDQGKTIVGVGGGGSDVSIQGNWLDVNNLLLGSEIRSRAVPTTKIQMTGHQTWVYSQGAVVADFSPWSAKFFKPVISTSHVDATGYKVNGVQAVGTPCAPIANSNGSLADNTRATNELLGCLRTHGLLQSQ